MVQTTSCSSICGFESILDEIRSASITEADKGRRFEKLMKRYLQTDPVYQARFNKVWLWDEWPYRDGKPDQGIDLVAQEADGTYCGIQCKCYESSHNMDLSDISTFFSSLHVLWPTDLGKRAFDRGMVIATTDKWNDKVRHTIQSQDVPCETIGLTELINAPIDWDACAKTNGQDLHAKAKYDPRPHQEEAIADVIEGFQHCDRGKLIMACGTGKTFTSLRLVEKLTDGEGAVLFLVPSIALLSQSLREWLSQARTRMHAIAVCSDAKAAEPEQDSMDLTSNDIPAPACTDAVRIGQQYQIWKKRGGLVTVFSTYQSLSVIHEAQERGKLPEFDIIVCDEAHRTTGVALKNEKKSGYDESHFIKVHDNEYVKAKKRLYMTATPRVYSPAVRKKAEEADALLASMDDIVLYGEELHRLPFSKAVKQNLLTDYKVLVLCVSEDRVKTIFKRELEQDADGSFRLDDAVKLMGCYNGLRKRIFHRNYDAPILREENDKEDKPLPTAGMRPYIEEDTLSYDPDMMQRAVAFAGSIADSKRFCKMMAEMMPIIEEAERDDDSIRQLPCEMRHVDGTMDVKYRNSELTWLKSHTEGGCRVLCNVRCLSEGVDVPALDSVMFLSPRRSQVDIIQAVGRVMRKAEGKKYGYIILPIGVPDDVLPEDVLDKDEKYDVVWEVLQALRAHDDRFNIHINQIELNGRHSGIVIGGDGTAGGKKGGGKGGENGELGGTDGTQPTPIDGGGPMLPGVNWDLIEWNNAILARIVKRCGTRRYWETWAKDIADIAQRQIDTLSTLLEEGHGKEQFDQFLAGLRKNINPSINEDDALEMLAQQMITRPVFRALFSSYAFTDMNPVSKVMNEMLDALQDKLNEDDARTLNNFYESVKERATGIDTAEGKQKIVVELYDKFFKNAFPKMVEKLGIVYTPIEVVDFIVHSVHHVLKTEFGLPKGIATEGVRVLDPFTGTGTFIVRLIQSGFFTKKQLRHKFREELFASEIVLLAYYIAAINIEEAYHGMMNADEYEPFNGICLTDTFQMGENKEMYNVFFPENSRRVKNLMNKDIRVIIANPPYSVGQKDANDNNQNQHYENLDESIEKTYAKLSSTGLKKGLYDSYIRAFRWASSRIADEGIVAFVTNGSFINSNTTDGFRKSLMKEFSAVYCFNLRGNQRTSGELSRKEGGKIFGSGSRTPVAITILVKKKGYEGPAKLFYHDIGDYLSREQKLNIIKEFKDVSAIEWEELTPDEHGDWLNHRDPGFNKFIPIGDKKTKGKDSSPAIFSLFSLGIGTNRDAWCYNSSSETLTSNMKKCIGYYNTQLGKDSPSIDPHSISWTDAVLKSVQKSKKAVFRQSAIRCAMYRPFYQCLLYYDAMWNHRPYQMPKLFPLSNSRNLIIQLTGFGSTTPFSCLISNVITDLEVISKGQCFPLHWYEKRDPNDNSLGLDLGGREGDYIRHDAITDYAWKKFRTAYGDSRITKEDIFYYVYGLLHSPEYRRRYEADLKKVLPRIPMAKNFRAFCEAGRELAKWHLDYESVEPYPLKEEGAGSYRVEKMRWSDKKKKDTLIYNSAITLSGFPAEAHEYIVNGKSALEWVIERYAVTTDKASGIVNDPNDWCAEQGEPRYIIDLVKRVVRVSVETVRIVNALPPIEEID